MQIAELDSMKNEFIQMCVKDLVVKDTSPIFLIYELQFYIRLKHFQNSGTEDWAEMHADILAKEYMKNILSRPENFDSTGLLKDELITRYGFRCMNDCSGHGRCIKSKTFFFISIDFLS